MKGLSHVENITINQEELRSRAELLKAIAHPTRLCIVRGLMEREGRNVSDIQCCLGVPQSTLSQHLAKLRNMGVVRGDRNGVEVNYYLINEDVKRVVGVLFGQE